MDQIKHAILVAQATGQIVQWLMSRVDFDKERLDSREYMEELGAEFGLSSVESLRGHDDLYEAMKAKVAAHCEEKAATEIAAAIAAATLEVKAHKALVMYVHEQHELLMKHINDSTVDEDSKDFLDSIRGAAQKFHDDMVKLLQKRHRVGLLHCFTGHLVPEATAHQLADLYEIKPA